MTRRPALKPSRGGSQPARFERNHTFSGPRTPMLPIDLEMRADVVIIPPEPGGAATLPYRDISVVSAIRYVVEELSRDERPRAVVCTPTGSLFINEIEALYDQPEFPKAA
jgi:hypothetical protein